MVARNYIKLILMTIFTGSTFLINKLLFNLIMFNGFCSTAIRCDQPANSVATCRNYICDFECIKDYQHEYKGNYKGPRNFYNDGKGHCLAQNVSL